ncbi:MAG: 3-hydroxyisobutyrate dehydrogenase, partial [Armatimonadetes bacterium]|nr:3-hydroxyisobutyrate dehydrogenase [Armatimonadota bacterium]
MTVGFLGLGWMGSNFARRLAGTGHRAVGFDPVPERLAAAVEL